MEAANENKQSKEGRVNTQTVRAINLWRCVLDQAVIDLLTQSKNPKRLEEKEYAYEWFFFPEHELDFFEVCDHAHINPHNLRAYLKTLLASPMKYRRLVLSKVYHVSPEKNS